MKIHTDYYGEIEYSKEDLVTFPEGLFGFPDLKYYLPLCLGDDDDSMLILQSTEKPEVVFLFINPAFLFLPRLSAKAYFGGVILSKGVRQRRIVLLCHMCVIKDNYMDNTVNLKCPLAINPLAE
ncbi:MAG: flagellar assembly protein FliW [Enterocloster clostridioformis]